MQLSITGPRRGNYARSAFKCAATAFLISATGFLLWCGLQNGHGYGTGASDIGAEPGTERGRGQAPSLLYTSLASAIMLSAAKHLCAHRDRCFAALSMTGCYCI